MQPTHPVCSAAFDAQAQPSETTTTQPNVNKKSTCLDVLRHLWRAGLSGRRQRQARPAPGSGVGEVLGRDVRSVELAGDAGAALLRDEPPCGSRGGIYVRVGVVWWGGVQVGVG